LAWVLKASVRKLRFRLRLCSLMFSVTYGLSLNRKIEDDMSVRISRFELRCMVTGKLDVFNRNVVSAYINWLIENKFLEMTLLNEFDEHNFMPKNTTYYLINRDWVNTRLKELTEKVDKHSHTTLEDYTKSAQEENRHPQVVRL
jgi:hypothetical protein